MANILSFLAFLLISVLIYWLVMPEKWRRVFLLILSFIFISVFGVIYALYFLLNVILIYIAGNYIREKPKNKQLLLKLSLVWLIGNICFFKYGDQLINIIYKLGYKFSLFGQVELPKILLPLGVSYIIFRLIHYIVEVYREKAPQSSFVDFALYVLFFPTFLAGPVDRFERFCPQAVRQSNFEITQINKGLFRLALGLVKKFVIADTLTRFLMPVLDSPADYSQPIIILCIYGLAIRIYMDFSGYTDMAIGVSKLFGYDIMENFNRPYLQKNIVLFWRNWHISLSSWIRDYFFFPFSGSRASTFKLYFGILLTMVVFHLWHGASIGFLILGAYHGVGIMTCQFFQEIKRKRPKLRAVVSHKWAGPVSIFVTFSFVSFGFIFFFFDIQTSLSIIKNIFV